MSSGIFDSSVLIDCLRGHIGAVAFLRSHSAAETPATHIMVAAELLAGARDKVEQKTIDSFLTTFHSCRLTNPTEWPRLTCLKNIGYLTALIGLIAKSQRRHGGSVWRSIPRTSSTLPHSRAFASSGPIEMSCPPACPARLHPLPFPPYEHSRQPRY